MSEWISVTERVPDKDGRYLCTIQNEYAPELVYIMVCNYWYFDEFSKHDWCPDDETCSSNVLAWMQLPDPFHADEEDNA